MTNAPEITTLRLPNPFMEGRNRVYLLRSDPLTLIDTGVATDKGFDALVDALAEQGLTLADIERVILTHKHIDHIGNAWRVQRAGGAEILIHEIEAHAISDADIDGSRYAKLVGERLKQWQVPSQQVAELADSVAPRWNIESAEVTTISGGQRLPQGGQELEVIHTPGHTMGSISLRFGNQLFSGDHVLPEISPNIGGGDMRHSGLLDHYLDSLEQTIELSQQIECTYPGHGEPLTNLAERCRTLLDHHRERLEKIEAILRRRGPCDVFQLARELFGEMRGFHIVLGCAEAQSHLEALVSRSLVEQDGEVFMVSS